MPKTNHDRDYKDTRDYTCPPGDWVNGKHGAMKSKRGGKKYKRSRLRFHLNSQTKSLVDEDISMETTVFEVCNVPRSKLRKTSNSGPPLCPKCGVNAAVLSNPGRFWTSCGSCQTK